MTVLVTGYQGFIASRLIKEIGEPAVKLEYGDYPILPDELKDVRTVVHVGAIPVMNPKISPYKYFDLNVRKTVELLEAAKQAGKVNRFIFLSSCVVSYPLNNIYDYSKANAEDWVRIYRRYFPTYILRLHNIYGEGNTKGPVENWAQALKKGEPITITGDGSQERDMVYVGDVVRAIEKLMYGYFPPYPPTNIPTDEYTWEFGTGQVISMKDLAYKMVEIWNGWDHGTEREEPYPLSNVHFVPMPYAGLQTVRCPSPLFFADMTPLDEGLRYVLKNHL